MFQRNKGVYLRFDDKATAIAWVLIQLMIVLKKVKKS